MTPERRNRRSQIDDALREIVEVRIRQSAETEGTFISHVYCPPKGFRIEEKRDLLSNVPFAGVFAQEIVERRQGKAILLTFWPFSLISESDLLIDIVTLSAGKAHFES